MFYRLNSNKYVKKIDRIHCLKRFLFITIKYKYFKFKFNYKDNLLSKTIC